LYLRRIETKVNAPRRSARGVGGKKIAETSDREEVIETLSKDLKNKKELKGIRKKEEKKRRATYWIYKGVGSKKEGER